MKAEKKSPESRIAISHSHRQMQSCKASSHVPAESCCCLAKHPTWIVSIPCLFYFHGNEIGICSINGRSSIGDEHNVIEVEVVTASLHHSG